MVFSKKPGLFTHHHIFYLNTKLTVYNISTRAHEETHALEGFNKLGLLADKILETQKVDFNSHELYITDTVTTLAQQDNIAIYTPQGQYLDGGNPTEWLKANLIVARSQPEVWEKIKKHFSTLQTQPHNSP